MSMFVVLTLWCGGGDWWLEMLKIYVIEKNVRVTGSVNFEGI